MNTLADSCHGLKSGFTPKHRDSTKPVRCWSEQDRYNDTLIDAFVIILRTKGCSWARQSGCSMCGYFNDSLWTHVAAEDLIKQYTFAMQSYRGEPVVKLFTSGSFLDTSEMPIAVQHHIINDLSDKVQKISFESRPAYVTKKRLDTLSKDTTNIDVELGIGLETANDTVRMHAINKGFTFDDYLNAAHLIKEHGMLLKTYVLIKPIFLTEQASIQDAIGTVTAIKAITDTVSFNPCNVQRNTMTEYLWKRHAYRPPWLWSVLDVLEKSSHLSQQVRLQCDVAGGGSKRGAHNCGKCDTQVLAAIKEFSLTQDTAPLLSLNCPCKEQWLDQLDLEQFTFGSIVDFSEEGLI
jgi:radical SAM enzyme (TIGR01210 family)